MKYTLRHYKNDDFPMIASWWEKAGEPGPRETMMLEESSFIIEVDSVPAYSITVYMTNCKELAYLENFSRNPEIKNKDAAQALLDYVCGWARIKGYKHLITFGYHEKLKTKFVEYGFMKTLDNLSGFVKEL